MPEVGSTIRYVHEHNIKFILFKKVHQFRPYTISSIPLFHQFRPTQISDLKSNCNPQNQISNPIANPQNQAVKSMTVLAMGSAQHVTLKKTPGHSALRRRTDAKCITRDTTAINKQQSNQSKSIKIIFKSKPNQNNHFTHTLSTHTWNRCNASDNAAPPDSVCVFRVTPAKCVSLTSI